MQVHISSLELPNFQPAEQIKNVCMYVCMYVLKRGKRTVCEGISLPDNLVIKSLEEDGSYKYLGILEADQIMHKDYNIPDDH